jgi:hypothetical protein
MLRSADDEATCPSEPLTIDADDSAIMEIADSSGVGCSDGVLGLVAIQVHAVGTTALSVRDGAGAVVDSFDIRVEEADRIDIITYPEWPISGDVIELRPGAQISVFADVYGTSGARLLTNEEVLWSHGDTDVFTIETITSNDPRGPRNPVDEDRMYLTAVAEGEAALTVQSGTVTRELTVHVRADTDCM